MTTNATTTPPLAAGLAAGLAARKEAARTRYREILLSGTDEGDELTGIMALLSLTDSDLASDEISAATVATFEPQLPLLKASADAATADLGEAGKTRNAAILAAQTEYQEKLKDANAVYDDVWRRQRQAGDEYEKARQSVLGARARASRVFG